MAAVRIAVGVVVAIAFWVCRGAQCQTAVIGAGSTFSAPIYKKWIDSFQVIHPGLPITYDPTSSEEGLGRLEGGAADFAASDFPPGEDVEKRLGLEMLPTVIGGVVPAYNIAGIEKDLRFTPDILAGIYLGQIQKWNDPKIKAANRGVKLPEADIAVIHRSDGSGTTYVWSEFLSKSNSEWRSAVGTGSSLHWPVGEGVATNEGVAQRITRTPNSIGYVEFIYALQNHLSYGSVQNAAGKFVSADIDSLTAAALAALSSTTYRISITNAPNKNAYPIASFTWIVIQAKVSTTQKRERLAAFLDWALSYGQKQAAALGYVALPQPLAERERLSVAQWAH